MYFELAQVDLLAINVEHLKVRSYNLTETGNKEKKH